MRKLSVAVAALLCACGLSAQPTDVPDACMFPPGTELAFAGRSSLAALKIDARDARPGFVVVTANPISTVVGPEGELIPAVVSRYACIVWSDDNSSTRQVPDDWDADSD
jgi:hypothetical protein